MVTALAWAYVRFGALPQIAGVLYGIKPVVIAIVVQALWGLAPKAIKKSIWLGALGLVACVASALGAEALLVLLGGGIVVGSRTSGREQEGPQLDRSAPASWADWRPAAPRSQRR